MTAMARYVRLAPAGAEQPLLVSIPHTGTYVPADIAAALVSNEVRSLPMTDWHLHHLYAFLPQLGVEVVHATYSRYVVDLNRAPDSRPLYPGRFETGLVPLQSFQGESVWQTPPSAAQIEERRRLYHVPYHRALAGALATKRDRFGRAWLIDAHSVASRASLLHPELSEDIYLGDRDGQSCESWLPEFLAGAFAAQGLRVARNAPYKGGYTTDHYGRLPGIDALQIEMCQRIYMDEAAPAGAETRERFVAAQAMLRSVFESLLAELQRRL